MQEYKHPLKRIGNFNKGDKIIKVKDFDEENQQSSTYVPIGTRGVIMNITPGRDYPISVRFYINGGLSTTYVVLSNEISHLGSPIKTPKPKIQW